MYRTTSVVAGRLRVLSFDMPKAVDEFTSQLQDASKPAACPACLHLFSRALWDGSIESIALDLMSTRHDFWSACAAAASAPGPDGDLGLLRSLLFANKMSCRHRQRHAHSLQAPDDVVACFLDALCCCLFAALKLGPHRKQKNIFLGRDGLWPGCLEDIMPATLAPYARWACIVPTRYPIALISRLSVVARRRIMEDLSVTPSRERLVAACIRGLSPARAQDADMPASSQDLVARDPLMGEPVGDEIRTVMGHVLGLLVVFQAGPDRRLNDLIDFAAGFERPLHDAILEVASSPGFGSQYDQDLLACAASALAAKAELPVHPLVAAYRQKPHIQRYMSEGLTIGDIIYLYLRQRLDSRVCSGPDCGNCGREDDSGMLPLLVCAQCRVMRYCGPECQRRDWRHGGQHVPHKIVCSAIRKFRDAGILEDGMTMNDFSRAYFDTSFLTIEEFVVLAELVFTDDVIPLNIKSDALQAYIAGTHENAFSNDATDGASNADTVADESGD